jgi:uncharacterized MnhB-related membrane protein
MSDAKVYFFFLLATFLVTSLWVLLSRKLINMIVAVGIGSILLSILFFFFGNTFCWRV